MSSTTGSELNRGRAYPKFTFYLFRHLELIKCIKSKLET